MTFPGNDVNPIGIVDVEALQANLLGAPIDTIVPLNKGFINNNFLVIAGPKRYFLKVYTDRFQFLSPRLSPQNRAHAEYRALQLCQLHNLPASEPVALLDNALLMREIDGTNIKQVPLTTTLVSALVSWLTKFHSMEVLSDLSSFGVSNLSLVAALEHMRRYTLNNPHNAHALEIAELLERQPSLLSGKLTLSHGDPTIGNWLLKGDHLFAVDFEFFALANPVFDVGLLLASILERGKFMEDSLVLAQHALSQYLYQTDYQTTILSSIRLATLCGLILIAVTVPDAERSNMIFLNAKSVFLKISNWEG